MNLSNEKRFKISYEIILNEDIDYYNDFLPICKSTRYDIETKKNGDMINKLMIFTFYDNEYPLKNSIFEDLKNEGRDEFLHYWNYTEIIPNFESINLLLSYYIRHGVNFKYKLNEENIIRYKTRIDELANKNMTRIENDEKKRLTNLLIYNFIVEKINEIKELEQSYYELVALTPQQNKILKKVLKHPKLKDKIQSHGFKISHVIPHMP